MYVLSLSNEEYKVTSSNSPMPVKHEGSTTWYQFKKINRFNASSLTIGSKVSSKRVRYCPCIRLYSSKIPFPRSCCSHCSIVPVALTAALYSFVSCSDKARKVEFMGRNRRCLIARNYKSCSHHKRQHATFRHIRLRLKRLRQLRLTARRLHAGPQATQLRRRKQPGETGRGVSFGRIENAAARFRWGAGGFFIATRGPENGESYSFVLNFTS